MHYFFKICSLLPGIDRTNQVCSNDDKGRVYLNYKFHDPWGRGSCARMWPYTSYSETAVFLYQSSSLLPGIDQTIQVCRNDDQGRVYQIKIVNFMTPGVGFLCQGVAI